MCDDRHRHQEWLKCLRVIDHVTPADKDLYLIVDSASTHKHAKVRRWLAWHPCFPVYFTPTSSSRLKRGRAHLPRPHATPPQARGLSRRRGTDHDDWRLRRSAQRAAQPFNWTALAKDILGKVARAPAAPDNR
jgi:hypothetical protein